MREINGRTAVVTGAGSGIGRAIALALSAAGANVAVADIDKAVAEAVAADIAEMGGRSSAHFTDVSQLEEVRRLADDVYQTYGSVEILVNNAGVNLRPFRASWDTSYEDFQWVMNVNFWGVLHGHHVFVPRMLQTEGEKHIVNTSSAASLLSIAGISAYSASKRAVDGLSHSAREELRTQGIGVSILHPGPIRTRVAFSERLRPVQEQSDSRQVKPWTDYLGQRGGGNAVVEGTVEKPQDHPDVAATPWEYITPNAVGQMVVDAIKNNEPHILTHPAPVEELQTRLDAILAASPEPRKS
jgi:NAD(P)-dependent dehydrogenase (short-subunit alcohol dehydrogenase family)